ncbi:hypothetical protein H4R18_004149 [Coemansia javaensis]|uniref:Uncharacterized protein n=1 Tax=Coemansia javaensis TaxID=2761396 RepID=A0A9W8LHJ0_9FUNG|nr:hypothetical protein H4R18_004149 [Coemansia javaensis]
MHTARVAPRAPPSGPTLDNGSRRGASQSQDGNTRHEGAAADNAPAPPLPPDNGGALLALSPEAAPFVNARPPERERMLWGALARAHAEIQDMQAQLRSLFDLNLRYAEQLHDALAAAPPRKRSRTDPHPAPAPPQAPAQHQYSPPHRQYPMPPLPPPPPPLPSLPLPLPLPHGAGAHRVYHTAPRLPAQYPASAPAATHHTPPPPLAEAALPAIQFAVTAPPSTGTLHPQPPAHLPGRMAPPAAAAAAPSAAASSDDPEIGDPDAIPSIGKFSSPRTLFRFRERVSEYEQTHGSQWREKMDSRHRQNWSRISAVYNRIAQLRGPGDGPADVERALQAASDEMAAAGVTLTRYSQIVRKQLNAERRRQGARPARRARARADPPRAEPTLSEPPPSEPADQAAR